MAYRQLALVFCLVTISGCEDRPSRDTYTTDNYTAAIQTWQRRQHEQAIDSVAQLSNATNNYLDGNTDRENWQLTWREAHKDWHQASFLSSEIDTRLIDAWPIAPGFLDSIQGYPHSGIVHDESLEISSEVMRHQHQITDDVEAALGFHVLEYYAFARDANDLIETDQVSQKRRLLVRLAADMLLLEVTQISLENYNKPLIRRLLARSKSVLSEYNRAGEHSQFSETSLSNVANQLRTLSDLLQEPVAYNNYLISLDPDLAETFNDSLNEAIELTTGKTSLDDNGASRLLLLLSSLSHQLEDFVRLAKASSVSRSES